MRLIDADALFEHKVYAETPTISGDFVPGFVIDRAPTIDAVPVVRARWVYYGDVNEDGNCEANCSACGAGDAHRPDLKNAVPYCWNCGARMDGEAE